MIFATVNPEIFPSVNREIDIFSTVNRENDNFSTVNREVDNFFQGEM